MSELEWNEAFPVKNKGNESNKKLIKAFSPRTDGIVCRDSLFGLFSKMLSYIKCMYQIGTMLHAGNHAFFISMDVFMTLL